MSEVPEWWVLVVAWVLVLAPLLPIAVAAVLLPDIRSHNIPLRERVGVAIRDAILASLIGILAANALFGWDMDDWVRFVMLVAAYLSISAPSVVWLWLFARGRFR
jgi:hypothetical protein